MRRTRLLTSSECAWDGRTPGARPFLLSRRNHPVARDDGAPSRRGGGFEGGGVGAGRGRYGAGGPDGGRYCLFNVAAILPTVLRLAATIAATTVW